MIFVLCSTFQKRVIAEVGRNALELGLLFGNEKELINGEDEWLSFPHKMIHEYIAACFLVREIAANHKLLNQLFGTWKDIKRHEEVYNFCIGCSSDSCLASLLINHLCMVLSATMLVNVKTGALELCHSRQYKIDTTAAKNEEMRNYSDKIELIQVFSAVCREARAHVNTCTNPVCNEFIHVYPACTNTDPFHVIQSQLLVFTDKIRKVNRVISARDDMAHQKTWGEKCLVIFGDNNIDQDLTSINQAMSNCIVTQIYMKGCNVIDSEIELNCLNVESVFTESLQALYIKDCELPDQLWNEIGNGLAGSQAIERVRLRDCTGVTEHLIMCIGLTSLTDLRLDNCNLSSEMCELICKELKHFTHLEWLDLSANPVGAHVVHLTAAIRAWGPVAVLKRLVLASCELPGHLVPDLLNVVALWCRQLRSLDIGENKIGGCLWRLMSDAPDSLQYLFAHSCNLQAGDVDSISKALRNGKLLDLQYLDIEHNGLSNTVVAPLVEAAKMYHRGKLEMNLRGNSMPAESTAASHREGLHLYHEVPIASQENRPRWYNPKYLMSQLCTVL